MHLASRIITVISFSIASIVPLAIGRHLGVIALISGIMYGVLIRNYLSEINTRLSGFIITISIGILFGLSTCNSIDIESNKSLCMAINFAPIGYFGILGTVIGSYFTVKIKGRKQSGNNNELLPPASPPDKKVPNS